MSETVVVDNLAAWRECRDCGLFQRLPHIPDGEAAICGRCAALLRRSSKASINFARASSLIAAALFLLALTMPLVGLRVLGRVRESSIFSGAESLREHGLAPLALVVLATLVIAPAVKLAIELTVLFAIRARHTPRQIASLFRWLEHVSPWAMIEVFLLGALVAYTRLNALAHVDIGLAGLALVGVMLCMVAVDATLDREAIWRAVEARSDHPVPEPPPRPGDEARSLIGCDECRRVWRADEGEECARCGHHMTVRRGRHTHVAALVMTAALLYIPANVLPVMTIKRLGSGGPTTIFNGVVELARNHLWPLAILVLFASVIVPIGKLLSLALMIIMTRRHSPRLLMGRTRLFRLVKFVGRWSMLDIFMLSVLVGVVRFGRIATVSPGGGALAFCAVVLTTMVATEIFDPRTMWDAGHRSERAVSTAGGGT